MRVKDTQIAFSKSPSEQKWPKGESEAKGALRLGFGDLHFRQHLQYEIEELILD